MAPEHTDSEQGPNVAEYLVIVSLIVVTAVVALIVFGTQIGAILSLIAERIHE